MSCTVKQLNIKISFILRSSSTRAYVAIIQCRGICPQTNQNGVLETISELMLHSTVFCSILYFSSTSCRARVPIAPFSCVKSLAADVPSVSTIKRSLRFFIVSMTTICQKRGRSCWLTSMDFIIRLCYYIFVHNVCFCSNQWALRSLMKLMIVSIWQKSTRKKYASDIMRCSHWYPFKKKKDAVWSRALTKQTFMCEKKAFFLCVCKAWRVNFSTSQIGVNWALNIWLSRHISQIFHFLQL